MLNRGDAPYEPAGLEDVVALLEISDLQGSQEAVEWWAPRLPTLLPKHSTAWVAYHEGGAPYRSFQYASAYC